MEEVSPYRFRETLKSRIKAHEVPDIILTGGEYDWLRDYPGGPDQAITDKVIFNMTPFIETHAENLMAFLKKNPGLESQLLSPGNQFYFFPRLNQETENLAACGPLIRKDWLNKLHLPMPVNISDWEKVLLAFKKQMNAEAPLVLAGPGHALSQFGGSQAFIGAFRVAYGYYQRKGVVKYGPSEQGYYGFLTLMRRWYEKGLINTNFIFTTPEKARRMFQNGSAGVMLANLINDLSLLDEFHKERNFGFEMAAAPLPVLTSGKPEFGHIEFYFDGSGAVITCRGNKAKKAMKWLDWAFSRPGAFFL